MLGVNFSARTWRQLFLVSAVLVLGGVANAATFTNSSPVTFGAGVANNGNPYPSPIAVSGLTGTITEVKVTINNFSHTFPDDVAFVLVGPNGDAFLIMDGAGGDPDMSGVTFTLADSGTINLPDTAAWPAGTYKPTAHYLPGTNFPAPGPGTTHGYPGPAGPGTATFASVFNGDNPNGTWNLFTRDFEAGDGGSIGGGWTLEITTSGGGGPPEHPKHDIDFDGDGKADFALVRNVQGGTTGQISWFVLRNAGGAQGFDWGVASDAFVPNDYDGDDKTDYAVYRGGAWYILQTQTGTVRIDFLGGATDDESVVGDYDGDGKADLAVYRAGAASGDPSVWIYKPSLGGADVVTQWGQNGDFPAPGDYDGDDKSDFVIQRNAGGGQARFWFKYAAGSSDSTVFGTPTDIIAPGDYDGDGKTDLMVARGSGGQVQWWLRKSTDSSVVLSVFGNSATDFISQADYDFDGKTDIAVWRPSATAGGSFFHVLGSTAGYSMHQWGANGDYPVANYNTH